MVRRGERKVEEVRRSLTRERMEWRTLWRRPWVSTLVNNEVEILGGGGGGGGGEERDVRKREKKVSLPPFLSKHSFLFLFPKEIPQREDDDAREK